MRTAPSSHPDPHSLTQLCVIEMAAERQEFERRTLDKSDAQLQDTRQALLGLTIKYRPSSPIIGVSTVLLEKRGDVIGGPRVLDMRETGFE